MIDAKNEKIRISNEKAEEAIAAIIDSFTLETLQKIMSADELLKRFKDRLRPQTISILLSEELVLKIKCYLENPNFLKRVAKNIYDTLDASAFVQFLPKTDQPGNFIIRISFNRATKPTKTNEAVIPAEVKEVKKSDRSNKPQAVVVAIAQPQVEVVTNTQAVDETTVHFQVEVAVKDQAVVVAIAQPQVVPLNRKGRRQGMQPKAVVVTENQAVNETTVHSQVDVP